jgi:hypothetical protein
MILKACQSVSIVNTANPVSFFRTSNGSLDVVGIAPCTGHRGCPIVLGLKGWGWGFADLSGVSLIQEDDRLGVIMRSRLLNQGHRFWKYVGVEKESLVFECLRLMSHCPLSVSSSYYPALAACNCGLQCLQVLRVCHWILCVNDSVACMGGEGWPPVQYPMRCR